MLGKVMIEGIRAWINGSWTDSQDKPGGRQDRLKLALTALLIEAANCDDRFDQAEREVIARLLEHRFGLSKSDADQLIAAGEIAASESTELFHFTRIINDRLSPAERVDLVEMLWEVAYADRVLDEYEDSLLRRIGGLIYVPDRERGMARQRVLKRLGLDQAT
ncbi:MAG: TerB family tellurite resistance protein [Alphaproteobacteria bacterium]|nr:TerB family tellurite resistance protein [Alphaproteobacteria bacterium]